MLFASDLLKNYFDSNAQYNKSILELSSTVFRQLKMHQWLVSSIFYEGEDKNLQF